MSAPWHGHPRGQLAPRLALACGLLSMVASLHCAAADISLQQLMQQLAARRHAHASFVERKSLAVLKRTLESSGELIYEAPDRLLKRTLKPKAETLQLENGMLSAQRGARTYRMALRDSPDMAPFIDTIRATLAGEMPTLQRTYELEFRSTGGNWTLLMVPREPQLARVFARIRIDGAGDLLREVIIDTADGDRSVMTIRDIVDP